MNTINTLPGLHQQDLISEFRYESVRRAEACSCTAKLVIASWYVCVPTLQFALKTTRSALECHLAAKANGKSGRESLSPSEAAVVWSKARNWKPDLREVANYNCTEKRLTVCSRRG